jgi:FkbM family methyltransferase
MVVDVMIRRAREWIFKRRRREGILDPLQDTLANQDFASIPQGTPMSNNQLRRLFLSLLRQLNLTIFCDIGANDGEASLAVRRILPTCGIYAFEANPRTYQRNRSRLPEGIRYFNFAISDLEGQVPIFAPRVLSKAYVNGEIIDASIVEPEDTGKASLLRRTEEATYTEFNVRSYTLDGFLRSQGERIDDHQFALWIDVEGAAAKVLAGAEKTLAHTAIIFIEVENYDFWQDQKRSADVYELLSKRDFIPVARDRESGDMQFNILFLNRKHASLGMR